MKGLEEVGDCELCGEEIMTRQSHRYENRKPVHVKCAKLRDKLNEMVRGKS